MAASAFKKSNAQWAENDADSKAIEMRRVEIVSAASGMIAQLHERGVVDTQGPVDHWLTIAANSKEYPRVRVFAISAIDSVIGNLASAIYFNKQDSQSGIFDDAFSRSVAARSGQLADDAPLAQPLLKSLHAIAQQTTEPQVRLTAADVHLSVGRALAMIEGHRGSNERPAAGNTVANFPTPKR